MERYKMSSAYRTELKKAETIYDCQIAYNREFERKYKGYIEKYNQNYEVDRNDIAFQIMICLDYDIWRKAERRAIELKRGFSYCTYIATRT